jgi:hypothetical protein
MITVDVDKLVELPLYQRTHKIIEVSNAFIREVSRRDKNFASSSCGCKKKYPSKRSAMNAVHHISRDRLRCYYCRFCHKWHLTSSMKMWV